MITGTISANQGRIQISVRGRDGRFKNIEAVVDTGLMVRYRSRPFD